MERTLLHICCAPCAVRCIETLRDEGIEPTGYWYNPNIHPYTEYRSRKETLIAHAAQIGMKLEINKAFKRRIAREKKKQEKIDLAPAQAAQPKSRDIRYDNIKSAMAEETVIAMALKEPGVLDGLCGSILLVAVPAEELVEVEYRQVLDAVCNTI